MSKDYTCPSCHRQTYSKKFKTCSAQGCKLNPQGIAERIETRATFGRMAGEAHAREVDESLAMMQQFFPPLNPNVIVAGHERQRAVVIEPTERGKLIREIAMLREENERLKKLLAEAHSQIANADYGRLPPVVEGTDRNAVTNISVTSVTERDMSQAKRDKARDRQRAYRERKKKETLGSFIRADGKLVVTDGISEITKEDYERVTESFSDPRARAMFMEVWDELSKRPLEPPPS